MLEIEVKIRVKDLEIPRSRLIAHGAQYSGRVTERDIYFNSPSRDFGETDEALRIRYSRGTEASEEHSAVLTYKGARQKERRVKAREEHACMVSDGSAMETIITALGFHPVATVEKLRDTYLYREAVVSLDTVKGLGTFVEIEVQGLEPDAAERRIIEVGGEIGTDQGTLVPASYLELVLSTRSGAQS